MLFCAVAAVTFPQEWATRNVSQGSHLSPINYVSTLHVHGKSPEWELIPFMSVSPDDYIFSYLILGSLLLFDWIILVVSSVICLINKCLFILI